MLSTRRVYPSSTRWDARETEAALGDETFYGRNKPAARPVFSIFSSRYDFRLSNVFGFEYEPGRNRRTFLPKC